MSDWVSFLPFFGAVVLTALSGAFFRPGDWYRKLDKPSWTPPDWLFGPAWTLLYIMIAAAGWPVWKADGFGPALAMWAANLVFNFMWSWLMFGRHQLGAALADAFGMLATILGFIVLAWPLSQTAALLFLPYLGWVPFASALNYDILRRNAAA